MNVRWDAGNETRPATAQAVVEAAHFQHVCAAVTRCGFWIENSAADGIRYEYGQNPRDGNRGGFVTRVEAGLRGGPQVTQEREGS